MRNASQGTGNTHNHTTMVEQGISMDFGFIIQRSNNPTRFERFVGLNGETAYLFIVDHFGDLLWGLTTTDKSPPIDRLNCWSAQFCPHSATFHYAMDEGG
jgi:hypothetical protein